MTLHRFILLCLALALLGVRMLRKRAAGARISRVGAAVLVLLLALIAGVTWLGMPAMFAAPVSVMVLFSPGLAWPAPRAGVLAALGAVGLAVGLVARPKTGSPG